MFWMEQSTSDGRDNAVDVLLDESNTPLSGITDINAGGYFIVLLPMKLQCALVSMSTITELVVDYYSCLIPDNALYPTALDVTLPSDKEVVSVHVGSYTCHAVFSDNSVYAWGRNSQGTLGDGSAIRSFPLEASPVLMDFDDFN